MGAGSERDASIEAVINWLLENPDMSSSDVIESDGREAAAESKISCISFFIAMAFSKSGPTVD